MSPSARALSGLLASVLLAACKGTPRPPAAPSERPNVLLLVVDALRADGLGVEGYPLPTSPAIDALAAEGVHFTGAFAPATWTKPSIATLLTSLYPPQHGLQAMAERRHQGQYVTTVLEEPLVSVAEAMQAGGYRTGAIVNQVHLQRRFGFAQGFDTYAWKRGWRAPGLVRLLLAWVRAAPDRPFFAYVHFLDAHWPYCSSLAPTEIARFGGRPLPGGALEHCEQRLDLEAPAAELRARYDAEVAYVDHAIGALVAALREDGLLENTIVVVTADHGEAFQERGRRGHAGPPHLEQARVPLVIRPPQGGAPRVRAVDAVVGLVDVAPTLLELAGLPPLAEAEGRSLVPLLRGEPMPERLVYSQGAGALAVRGNRWTWLRLADGTVEIYDRQRDPAERRAMHWACAGDCARLQPAAERYLRLARRVRPSGRSTAPLSAEDVAELRALGYL